MRQLRRCLIGSFLLWLAPVLICAQSITANFTDSPSAGCTPPSGCTSFTTNVSGAVFVFTLNSTDVGGSMQWLAAGGGVGGGASMDVLSSTLPEETTTEKVVIERQDAGDFNFTSIYIQNTGGKLVTVQGYNNGAPVGSAQTVANGVSSTLNFSSIIIDKVELSSVDFFETSFDDFTACIIPAPSFTVSNTVCLGAAFSFTDASTLVATEATYAWDFNNDGITDNTTKGNVSHTYATPGVHTAKLTITQGGCSSSTTQQTTVQDISATPVVNDPIAAGATSVSGTSTETDGSAIVVFKAGNTQIGTANVTGGTWTAVVPVLNHNDVITAKATATGECQSPASAPVTAIDNTPPSVTVNQASGQNDPTNASPVNFTVVFSKTVLGFTSADIILGGSAGATTALVTGSGPTYNVAVSGMTGSGTVTISIGANAVTDEAGNNNTASTSTDNTVAYDGTAPTVTINQAAGQADPTNASPVNFIAVFSEPVSGFTTGDVSLSGTAGATTATVTEIAPMNGTTFNVSVSGMSGSGTVIASITTAVATDLAGNNNAESTSTDNTVNYDNTAPTVTINQAIGQPDPTNNLLLNFTVQFSETVTGFTSSDVVFTGSTVPGNLVATVTGSGATYNVQVTGQTGDGLVEVSVPAGVAADGAGNLNTASTSTDNTLTYDITLPIATIEQAVGQADPTNTTPINFTVVFTEPVVGFTVNHFSITGTAIPNVKTITPVNNLTYTLSLSGFSGSGTVTVSLPPGGGISDLAGNGFHASSSTDNMVTYDIISPTVTINQASGQADPSSNTTIHFTTAFSEPVTGFTSGDVTLTGTAGATTTVVSEEAPNNGTTFNVAVSGMTITGTVIVTLGANVAFDAANNGNAASTSIDNTVNFVPCTTPDITVGPSAQAANQCSATPLIFSVTAIGDGLHYQWSVDGTNVGTDAATLSYNPSALGEGMHTVRIDITGTCGSDYATTTLTINPDIELPTITGVSVDKSTMWPPNHKMHTVQVNYTASDNCGIANTTLSVSSSDPINGTGDGDTAPDWIVTDAHHVQLRAERSNSKEQRVYTITITTIDVNGNSNNSTVTVIVAHNIVTPLSGASFKIGSTVNFAGVFWDKPGNKHTANWNIDGTTVKATVTEPSGTKNGKVTGSYKFTTAGVYKLQMNVTDQNKATSYCNTNEDLEAIVVIYDPNGGYAYGGGQFVSPAGALIADPTATGLVSYGFTVNYYKRATFPKGETQLEFKVGSLEYNALNFDYLSISGANAQFKGTGKIIGGQSGINFIMTVVDGQLDGTGVDKVRMKIYNKNTGQVYYDNETGASDAAFPTSPVGLNSSVTISGNDAAARIITGAEITETDTQLEVFAYPNPSNTNFSLKIRSGASEKIFMKVADIYGRVIEVRSVLADQTFKLGDNYRPGTYVVQFIQGKQHRQIKLVKLSD